MIPTLADVLALFDLDTAGASTFRGSQYDPPNHHIVGGQIAAQALMAAGMTVEARLPHSLHVYFLRQGDARQPVLFEVTRLRDGGTFSARRVAASQGGAVLMEGLASFTAAVDNVEYQVAVMPDAPAPETLVPVEHQLASYAAESDGRWVQPRAFQTRYVDPPPRIALDQEPDLRSHSRIWLHANGHVPDDPTVSSCVLTYLSALTLIESAMTAMGRTPMDTGFSALLDHAVWFHRPADFADWLLYDQCSPSGVAGRGLATGAIYNRNGELVCAATQEAYFGKRRSADRISRSS